MLKSLPTRKPVSFVGLAPRVSQSGERTGKGLGITRRGDSYMRSLLYLAARAAASGKAPGITDHFNRKLSGTKESGAHPRRSAVIATAVKMLGVVHALASDGGAKYDPKRVTGIIALNIQTGEHTLDSTLTYADCFRSSERIQSSFWTLSIDFWIIKFFI